MSPLSYMNVLETRRHTAEVFEHVTRCLLLFCVLSIFYIYLACTASWRAVPIDLFFATYTAVMKLLICVVLFPCCMSTSVCHCCILFQVTGALFRPHYPATLRQFTGNQSSARGLLPAAGTQGQQKCTRGGLAEACVWAITSGLLRCGLWL